MKRSTAVRLVHFLSLFFVALALGAALAHLFELPNKIDLPRDAYFTVQQSYRNWQLLGFVVSGALAATMTQAILARREPRVLRWTLVALMGVIGTQIVFWMFTFPANLATEDWTIAPPDWEELRRQWEYSHAISAGLYLVAHSALVLSLLARASSPRAAS